jgi:hypothetical protein
MTALLLKRASCRCATCASARFIFITRGWLLSCATAPLGVARTANEMGRLP